MLRFSPIFLAACLLFTVPARAQLPRCEGTLTQSGDGAPVRARVFFQPPDSLKVEVLDGAGGVAQTVVASGDTTQTFDARIKRVVVLGANVAREWWRDAGIAAGGPLNFAWVGAKGFVAAPDQGVTRVRDRVLLGNDERRAYYVASKARVRAFPARVELANGMRTDMDDTKNVVLRAKYALDGAKFPLHAEIGAGADTISFVYDLKPRGAAFPDGTFALPDAAQGAIREDATLKAPSSYADNTPDEQWNHGLALWRAGGDANGALELWNRAAQGKPTASAPHLAALDVLIGTRATTGAAREWEALRPMLSEADWAWTGLPLDDLRADRAAGLRDSQIAAKSGEPDRKLTLSLALRASGDIAGARGVWQELLSPDTPRAVAVKAAENYALSATPDEIRALGKTISGNGEAARLARALLDLRGGKVPDAPPTFGAAPFRAACARGLERAGRGEAARPLWESLEKSDAVGVQNEARAHLLILAARAGDTRAALGAWSRWNATLPFETPKTNARNVLFDAFQKAGQTEALRVSLLNRARATDAKDSDLRLALAFQEAYGTAESVAGAQSAGFDRFPDAPFWAGKRAESLVAQAFLLAPSETLGFRRRNALFKEANTLLDAAIKGADEPTFYTLQKALVQIQRATGIGGVVDPTEMANANDGARATLTRLDASPDPDFAAVAALGWNALPTPEDRQKALAAAERALDSPPDDGDRATLVFAARQVSARTLDGAGDPNGAARQWAILLDVAQSADDEAGLVAALLNSADRHKDALTSAQLLVRVANERWPLDGNAALLSGAAGRAAASPFMPQIGQNLDALVAHNDGGNLAKAAIVARAAFAVARLALANAQIAVPGAPPTADAELERATRAQSPALAALKPLAEGDDPFWATRARLLLLDAGTLAPDARRDLLQKLVASQGGEPSIALTLANADADPKARARAAQSLDFASESWRRLALDALDNGDKTGADFWSGEAFRYAETAPEIAADDFQSIAWGRAKILWGTGQTTASTALYTQLSGPSWNPVARAAALLALRKRLQEAGRAEEAKALEAQIKAIGLDKDGAQSAVALVGELDG